MDSTDRIIEALKAGVSPDVDESAQKISDQLSRALREVLLDLILTRCPLTLAGDK